MSTERRGQTVVIAVWLIALGAVFLIRDLADWSWAEAWPLFIIMVGTGSSASAMAAGHRPPSLLWSLSWSVAAIGVGVVLLLSTTGNLALSPGELLAWWPVLVIAIGVWFLVGSLVVRPADVQAESLYVPLDGAPSADIRVRFGGGELDIGPAEAGVLLSGHCAPPARQRVKGPGSIDLEPEGGWPFGWRPLDWSLQLTTQVPLDLRLETGANRSEIDLSSLQLRHLELKTGASETNIVLPAVGQTTVRAEAGVASLSLRVPQGVAARIRTKMTVGDTSVDAQRFPRTADGWASPDFDSATNRVELDIQGALGSVRVS